MQTSGNRKVKQQQQQGGSTSTTTTSSMSSDSYGGLVGAAAAELHLKMSKKIAQLTKVIFHLNTRNEDFQSEFAHAKRAHALELQQLSLDAATKLRQLHEQLQTQTNAAQQAERNAAHAKQQFQKDLAQYEQQMQATQTAAAKSFEQRVAQLEEQVEAARSAFSERAQQLVQLAETQQQLATRSSLAATAALQTAHASALEALKQQQHDEVAQLVTASNAKYNVMLAEQLRAQDALREELAVSRTALEQQLTLAASEHASRTAAQEQAARASTEALKHELVSKIETLLADAEVLRGHERTLRADKEALLQTQGEQQRRLQALEQQVTKAQSEAQGVRADADAHAARLQQLLSAGTDKIDALAQELETLRRTLQSRDQALRQAQRDLEAAQLETLQCSASVSEKDALLRQQTHERELELATLRAEATANSQQRARAEAALQQQLVVLQQQLAVLETQAAARDKELTAAHAALAASEQQRTQLQTQTDHELRELRAAGDESSRRVLELQRTHDVQLADLATAHARALQELTATSETKRLELERELQRSVGESLAEATSQLQREHAAALDKQTHALEAAQQALVAAQAQIAALERDAGASTKELVALRKSTGELAAQFKREQEQRAALASEHDTQRKASERARKEREDALTRQLKDAVAQRESAAKALAAEKQQLQLQHAQTLVALAREHEQKMRALRSEWDAEREALATELTAVAEQQRTALTDELRALQLEMARAASDALETQRAMCETSQFERESVRCETLRYVTMLADQHMREQAMQTQRMHETTAEHARALDELAARLDAERRQQLNDVQTHAEQHVAALESRHSDELALRAQLHTTATTELRAQLAAAHTHDIDALRVASAQQVRDLATRKDTERALALQDAQTRHAAALAALQLHADAIASTLAQRTAELAASAHACEQLQRAAEAAATDAAERLAALERTGREHVETLKRAAKRDMDRLLDENVAETQLLSAQFDETRQLMADKVARLELTITEWSDRFARRESRSEDVSRIAALERLVAEKDALVRQTLDEVAYIKRELLNREEMYNKTFARSPNVGVMNVLKPHVALQAQLQLPNGSGAPQLKRKTKPVTTAAMTGSNGPETSRSSGSGSNELQRRGSERGTSSSGTGTKKSLPPLTNNQVAL